MHRVEQALGTVKGENESWPEVLARINRTRGLDEKTIINVLSSVLEILDDKEIDRPIEEITFTGDPEVPEYTTGDGEDIGTEEADVHTGASGTEEEVPDRTRTENG